MKLSRLGYLIIAIFVTALILVAVSYASRLKRLWTIDNFTECQQAGYPIRESYPAVCALPDGRSFTQEILPEERKSIVPPS